jgi:hypothetical protein
MPVLIGLHTAPPAARWSKEMPMEFLHGRPLIRRELESLDDIGAVTTKSAVSLLATGRTCCRSSPRKKTIDDVAWKPAVPRTSFSRQTRGL